MTLINIWIAVLFGIVEGITEWLPISSTGHMIILEHFISFQNLTPGFWKMFEVVIQFGAIFAVVVLYFKKIWPFTLKKEDKFIKKDVISLWGKILVACVPAGIIGILFDDKIDELFYKPWVVVAALIIYGILFIVVEKWNRGRHPKITRMGNLTYKVAVWIGIFQLLAAVIPGTSRSGATIIGGLIVGTSRALAAEFTFYLAIPVMAGASLLKFVKYGAEVNFQFPQQEVGLLIIAMVVAFLVSVAIIRFLMSYIKKHNFEIFGWYRIALGIILIIYFAFTGFSL